MNSKALNAVHLSQCARCYGIKRNTKTLDDEVLSNLNKPTETGRASWCVRAFFILGRGQTKLAELKNFCEERE